MRIHKEGWPTILLTGITLIVLNAIVFYIQVSLWLVLILGLLSAIFFWIILHFFRNPIREISTKDDTLIYAPADGKIVVIEETEEPEYFKGKRLQVSIFMSPLNVHVNRYPFSGEVSYQKYHPGKYLVAWHPKSSELNERTSVVVKNAKTGTEVLMRQIAGALARRIVCYSQKGDKAIQGQDMGFIKFGSRVDLFLPVGTLVKVSINQVVEGNRTVIAQL